MRKWSSFQILFEALKLHLSYRKTVATEWHWRKTIDMAELPTALRLQIQSSATNAGRTELHQIGHRPEGCGYLAAEMRWELRTGNQDREIQTNQEYILNIHIYKYPQDSQDISIWTCLHTCLPPHFHMLTFQYSIYNIKATCMCRQSELNR